MVQRKHKQKTKNDSLFDKVKKKAVSNSKIKQKKLTSAKKRTRNKPEPVLASQERFVADKHGNPQIVEEHYLRTPHPKERPITFSGHGKTEWDLPAGSKWITDNDFNRSAHKINKKDNYLYSDNKGIKIPFKTLRDFDKESFKKILAKKGITRKSDITGVASKGDNDAFLHLVAKKMGWSSDDVKAIRQNAIIKTIPKNYDMEDPTHDRGVRSFNRAMRGQHKKPEMAITQLITGRGRAAIKRMDDNTFHDFVQRNNPAYAKMLENRAIKHIKKREPKNEFNQDRINTKIKQFFLEDKKGMKSPSAKGYTTDTKTKILYNAYARNDKEDFDSWWKDDVKHIALWDSKKIKDKLDNIEKPMSRDQFKATQYEQNLTSSADKIVGSKTGNDMLLAYSRVHPELRGTTNEYVILNHIRKNVKNKESFVSTVRMIADDPVAGKRINENVANKIIRKVTNTDNLSIKKMKRDKMTLSKTKIKDDFEKEIAKELGYARSASVIKHIVKKTPDEIQEAVVKKEISPSEAAQQIRVDAIDFWGDKSSNQTERKLTPKTIEKLRDKGIQVDRADEAEERGSGRPRKSDMSTGTAGSSKLSKRSSQPMISKGRVVEVKPGVFEVKEEKGKARAWWEKKGSERRAKKKSGRSIKSKIPYTMERKAAVYQKYKGTVGEKEATYLATGKGSYPWSKYRAKKRAEKMRWDEGYRKEELAKRTSKESWAEYRLDKSVRKGKKLKEVAASPWRIAYHRIAQRMGWLIVALLAIGVLFLPMGLFHVTGWAMAVGAVALIQFIIWIFIEFWFLLSQALVAVVSLIGQFFVAVVNAIGAMVTGALGQPWVNFEFNLVQNMAIPNIPGVLGAGLGYTWGELNLVPPSFLKLDWYMPTVFDTDTLIAKIIPALSAFFNGIYGPIAVRYDNWIATADWYYVGAVIGAPIVVALIVIGVAVVIKRRMDKRAY